MWTVSCFSVIIIGMWQKLPALSNPPHGTAICPLVCHMKFDRGECEKVASNLVNYSHERG